MVIGEQGGAATRNALEPSPPKNFTLTFACLQECRVRNVSLIAFHAGQVGVGREWGLGVGGDGGPTAKLHVLSCTRPPMLTLRPCTQNHGQVRCRSLYMAMSASRSFPKNWKSETHKGTTCNENVARQPKTSVT